ncbi:MAG: PQ-loop domain-containing transporter [Candidatus Micrarchaeia archaeon]|jgi:uncharacterized protein with PQ loop repeat
MLSWIGVGLIVLAWAFQIYKLTKNKKSTNISLGFVGLQIIGILLLVIGAYSNDLILSIINGLSCLGAIIVFILIKNRK